jgi:hypothetical protein
MGKASIPPEGHNRKRVRHRYYEELRRPDLEFHPVDTAVEARLFHRAVRRRIQHLQDRVISALGSDTKAFLQLDALLHDERREREEAYFDVGYEYGANAVRHRVLREMARGVWSERLERVAAYVHDEVTQVGLTPSETLLVLVESLWVLAVRRQDMDAD